MFSSYPRYMLKKLKLAPAFKSYEAFKANKFPTYNAPDSQMQDKLELYFLKIFIVSSKDSKTGFGFALSCSVIDLAFNPKTTLIGP